MGCSYSLAYAPLVEWAQSRQVKWTVAGEVAVGDEQDRRAAGPRRPEAEQGGQWADRNENMEQPDRDGAAAEAAAEGSQAAAEQVQTAT